MIEDDTVDVHVKEIGEATEVPSDLLVRTMLKEMFSNDNDTTYLGCSLSGPDGVESKVEFEIRLKSINGIETRREVETPSNG